MQLPWEREVVGLCSVAVATVQQVCLGLHNFEGSHRTHYSGFQIHHHEYCGDIAVSVDDGVLEWLVCGCSFGIGIEAYRDCLL